MSVVPKSVVPGELSVRSKADDRKVGDTMVYVTKSRVVPVHIGKGTILKSEISKIGYGGEELGEQKRFGTASKGRRRLSRRRRGLR